MPLAGAVNLRDLGGHRTSDGRRVRCGRVYRSGHVSLLTSADYESVASLGLSVVCDLRDDAEREMAPLPWPAPEILRLPTPPTGGALAVIELLSKGATGEDMSAWMRAAYARFPIAYGPAYRATLHRILTESGPLLYHCWGGKDRTGVLTALLLSLLGVPRATIDEDYLLSNAHAAAPLQIEALATRLNASLDAARAVLSVELSYLDAAFNAIDQEYGSIDSYRRTELALSDGDLVRLQALLLE